MYRRMFDSKEGVWRDECAPSTRTHRAEVYPTVAEVLLEAGLTLAIAIAFAYAVCFALMLAGISNPS